MNESEVSEWLEHTVGLPEYKQLFQDEGWMSLDALSRADLSDESLVERGIANKKHRAKLLQEMKKLNKEFEKKKKKQAGKVMETIESCRKKNDAIQQIWRTKIDKMADVKDLVATSSIVFEILDRLVAHLPGDSSVRISSDLLSLVRRLNSDLDEYSSHLVQLVKQKKLHKHLNTPHRRSKIAKFDSLVYSDIKFLLEESGIETLDDPDESTATKRNSLSCITQKDGRDLWIQQFGKTDVNMVPWPIFIKGFRAGTKHGDKMTLEDEILLNQVLDIHVGYVTPAQFSDLLSLFGPVENCISNLKDLYSQKWFTPYMSVEEVYRLLSAQPAGTYLVRFSLSHRDSFALEYVELDGRIRTVMVRSESPDGVIVTESDQQEHKFKSLKHVIAHYSDVLIRPYSADFLGKKWFYGDVDVDEAQELLANCPAGTFLVHFHGRIKIYGLLVCSYKLKNNTVKHIYLRKVKSGYAYQSRRAISGDGIHIRNDILDTHRNRAQSVSSPEVKNPRKNAKKSLSPYDAEQIYESLTEFIDSHRQALRYNYDSDGVPHLRFQPFVPNVPVELHGPDADKGVKIDYGELVSCQSISTYPRDSVGSQVLCDAFKVKIIGNRTLFVLADGCNWGNRSRDAAQKAVHSFTETLSAVQDELKDTTEAKHFLLRAFSKAHDAIIQGFDDIWCAGSTTLLGGMLVELHDFPGEEQYAFLCASVGDCKAFHWNKQTGVVTDITIGNRRNARDPRDCGGRIGPHMEGGAPDLRNLRSYFYPCKPGDLLLVVSDGVHDNFDPEHIGKSPVEVQPNLPYKTWAEIPLKEQEKLKGAYQCECIKKRITDLKSKLHPSAVTAEFVNCCVATTSKTRTYLEANPMKPEPQDFKEYPGKMDHTTCITLMVKPLGASSDSEVRVSSTTIDTDLSKSENYATRLNPDYGKKKSEVPKPIPTEQVKVEETWFFTKSIKNLLENFPKLDFLRADNPEVLSTLQSDDTEKLMQYGNLAAAWSLSTLPKLESEKEAKNKRGANGPIVERFVVRVYNSRMMISLSRGCTTGPESKEAATKTAATWMMSMSDCHPSFENTAQVAFQSVKALVAVHNELMEGKQTTTLVSGTVCKLSGLEDNGEGDWCFAGVSVGDSKVFLWNHMTGKIRDLTVGNEVYDSESALPKGRLGACRKAGKPDLSNFKLIFSRCQEFDILLAMSPNVYQNFDPVYLGKSPSDVGRQEKTWEEVSDIAAVRKKFRLQQLRKVIINLEKRSPPSITKALIQHCQKATESAREHLRKGDGDNTTKFPGRLGDSTVVALEIRMVDSRDADDSLGRGLHMNTLFKPMPKLRRSLNNQSD